MANVIAVIFTEVLQSKQTGHPDGLDTAEERVGD